MDKQAIQTIKTSELNPNSWNTNIVSPDNQQKIEESIRRFGMFKPLVCRTLENGQIEIIGGQHRWEAAKALGIEIVQIVNLGVIDDKKAKEISLVDNGRYGSDDALRLADLLKNLDLLTTLRSTCLTALAISRSSTARPPLISIRSQWTNLTKR